MGFWELLFGTGESTPAPRLDQRGRIGVMLESDGGNKIAAIKAVRELTGIGLAEAKDLVESAPCRVGATDAQSTANSAVAWLTRAGARASLQEQDEGPRPVQEASVRLLAVGGQKIAVIKAVREATGWGLAETKAWVESAPVVLDCGDNERALALLLALTDAGARAEIA